MKTSVKLKLSAYSASVVAMGILPASGQIIYHDIEPDFYWYEPPVEPVEEYSDYVSQGIDLDLDGDMDFYFEMDIDVIYGSTCCSAKYLSFKITGDNKDFVLYSETPGIFGDGVKLLNYGDEINSLGSFQKHGMFFSIPNSEFGPSYYGPWVGSDPHENKYFGFKIKVDGSFRYGWMRLDIDVDHGDETYYGYSGIEEIRLKDYAYHTLPNTAIVAGDMGGCNPPSVDGTFLIGSTNATLTWAPVPDASLYQIRYKKSGSPWINVSVAAPNISTVITALSCNTAYQWKIRTKCGGVFTPFSNLQFFTTASCRIGSGEELLSEIKIFPNPTTGILNIDLDKIYENEVYIALFNLLGEKVYVNSFSATDNFQISLSEYPKGNYLLRVFNNEINSSRMVVVN
ncbi:MAG: T9SS type A sorting domain-containing protein [Chitinophagales bacterium]